MPAKVPLYFVTYRDREGDERFVSHSETLSLEKATKHARKIEGRVLKIEATVVEEEESPNG